MAQSLNLKVGENQLIRRFDWNYFLVLITLQVIGLIVLYSAAHSATHLGRVFFAQMTWLALGWVVFFVAARINYRTFTSAAIILYVLNILALVAVLFIGKKVNGAQRWIDLGFFNFQPSETMKIVLFLYLANYLGRHRLENLDFKDLLKPGLIVGIPFILTVIQPDLGTALLLIAVPGSMILFLKIRFRVLVTAFLLISTSIPVAWKFGLKDYQKNRVLNFLNPERDPRGTGYNSIQAKIAIGSGQFIGKGFQQGSQSQLEFLPERHSDFIFCVLSEEYGFIGALMTLLLFFALLFYILNTAKNARDREGALICVGIASFIFWHMFINIGMVAGLLPIVGVPLPLISYGGSSLLSIMGGLGLVASVGNRQFMF